jgi:hypothetical protein
MRAWARWALLANGAALALLGAAHLTVAFVLPRLLAARERAQGIGLFDPTVGGDPILLRPHERVRTAVALVFIVAGLAHVGAAVLYRRLTRGSLTALVLLGTLSLVPTSVALAALALVGLYRADRAS